MHNTAILAIKYQEPSWIDTFNSLKYYSNSLLVVDRGGSGSLAEAINRGVRELKGAPVQNIWIVTNIIFPVDTLHKLERELSFFDLSAISPCFQSDHDFMNPKTPQETGKGVPFLEFTAPLVRKSLLEEYPLDEEMPYWGHDLDWGYRVRQAGYKLGVSYTAYVDHTYIRFNEKSHPVTAARYLRRKNTNDSTRARLVQKYGPDWNKILKYAHDGN